MSIIYLYKNPKKSLYDELVIQHKDKDPNNVIAYIKEFITNYKTESYDKEDKLIYFFGVCVGECIGMQFY